MLSFCQGGALRDKTNLIVHKQNQAAAKWHADTPALQSRLFRISISAVT